MFLTFLAILIGAVFELMGVAIILPIVELAMNDGDIKSNIFARIVSITFDVNDKEKVLS